MVRRALVLVSFVGCSASLGSQATDDSAPSPAGSAANAGVDASSPDDGSVSAETTEPDLDGGTAIAAEAGDGGPCSGFAYCEDYESYDGPVTKGAKLGPWTASVGGPLTATVDSVRPFAGKKSFHVVMPASTQASAMLVSPTIDGGLVPGNNLFGRAMIYFVGTPGDGGYGLPVRTHSMIFSVSGTSTDVGGPVNVNMNGSGALNYQQRKGTGFELGTAGGAPATNAWHCVQWEYDGSEEQPGVVADHLQVWLDGARVSDVPKDQGWHLATPWVSFQFGVTHLQTLENPVEVFFDSFALDGAMIPCPESAR